MEWDKVLELFFGFAGAAFSGLRWYSEYRRKRINPPSQNDQTDRNVG
ncbi:hypothetical protein [Cytobacillus sp. FSL R5-0596]